MAAKRFVVELLVEGLQEEISALTLAAEINATVRAHTDPLRMRVVGFTFRKERDARAGNQPTAIPNDRDLGA